MQPLSHEIIFSSEYLATYPSEHESQTSSFNAPLHVLQLDKEHFVHIFLLLESVGK